MEMVRKNLQLVKKRIKKACERVGRREDEVLVLGATKTRGIEEIRQAFEAGLTCIGESKVQEMLGKVDEFPSDLRVDFIGHLQRNKVKPAVKHCFLIHSVDSLRLAQEIDKIAGKQGKRQKILFEVNVAGEETKHGFSKEELKKVMGEILDLKGLKVLGLMTMEPYMQDPEKGRWIFKSLKKLRNDLRKKFRIKLPELSMGMSQDFEVAVEEGATVLRIGEGIFGPRR